MRVIAEKARVLITVKTTPQPSKKYKDIVCTAGVRLDGDRATWVRLYPIPFRYLDTDLQFKKYDVIELEIRRRFEDSRTESFAPDWESMKRVDHYDPWARRIDAMRTLSETNTCSLRRAAKLDHAAPSLGLGGVADVDKLEFERHPGWSDSQKAILNRALEEVDLFDDGAPARKLDSPLLNVSYRYRCTDAKCPGHRGQILDWELTALQHKMKGLNEAELRKKIEAKYLDQMFARGRDTKLFLGNFEAPIKRQIFSVLGVWWPREAEVEALPLF